MKFYFFKEKSSAIEKLFIISFQKNEKIIHSVNVICCQINTQNKNDGNQEIQDFGLFLVRMEQPAKEQRIDKNEMPSVDVGNIEPEF
jgi:hypothetical protein